MDELRRDLTHFSLFLLLFFLLALGVVWANRCRKTGSLRTRSATVSEVGHGWYVFLSLKNFSVSSGKCVSYTFWISSTF